MAVILDTSVFRSDIGARQVYYSAAAPRVAVSALFRRLRTTPDLPLPSAPAALAAQWLLDNAGRLTWQWHTALSG